MRYYFESQREGRFKMLDYYKGMDISFLQKYKEIRDREERKHEHNLWFYK